MFEHLIQNLNAETVLAAGGGAILGTTAVGWIVKILLTRLINQNDRKHEIAAEAVTALANSQHKAYQDLSHEISKLHISTKVIESRMGECMALRDHVSDNMRDIAVAQKCIRDNEKDIHRGMEGMRKRMTDVIKTMNQLKPSNGRG